MRYLGGGDETYLKLAELCWVKKKIQHFLKYQHPKPTVVRHFQISHESREKKKWKQFVKMVMEINCHFLLYVYIYIYIYVYIYIYI